MEILLVFSVSTQQVDHGCRGDNRRLVGSLELDLRPLFSDLEYWEVEQAMEILFQMFWV